jgi:hypothetical protein
MLPQKSLNCSKGVLHLTFLSWSTQMYQAPRRAAKASSSMIHCQLG